MSELHRPKVAILASGSGSTAEAFIRATQELNIEAEAGLVICNNPPEKAGIYDRVAQLNKEYGLDIQTVHISGRTHPGGPVERGQTDEESSAICKLVSEHGISLVALMGYMKVVRGELVEEYGYLPHFRSKYEARMLNTHPGPLPETADTFGIGSSERVLELGMTHSRHTVHVVAAGVDRGPIVAEHPVQILLDDTPQDVFNRVQRMEKALLPFVIQDFLIEQENYNRG
jgi:phosphoribosylglycinamide formyltransferase 1